MGILKANDMALLLEEANWVHALARRLVRDPHLAEDVAQEAWLQLFLDDAEVQRFALGDLPLSQINQLEL